MQKLKLEFFILAVEPLINIARFKALKAARKSQLRQLEVDLSFQLADRSLTNLVFLLSHLITQDQVQTLQSENISLQSENNSLQEEVVTLTEFGVLQSGQIYQQQEKAQFYNELWAITQKECWDAQKKVIQRSKYFENRYYHVMSIISKYDMIVVDNNIPESPFFVTSFSFSSSSSSFSSSFYDQIFVADGFNYINNNNNNNEQ
ncbi:hypothetical protein C1646_766900 [Rhizophagus diaphanus]|nr:hypothetical protein C1646_766900 [Rhizophagus diaphanus] [Rhizophagus sp. MUCL 43196]